MLLSNDKKAIKKARFWATQSREPARHYEHKEIGYNYRMSNIVAGIGRGQLLTLDEYKIKKESIYYQYQKAFHDISDIHMNPINPDGESNHWLSCVILEPKLIQQGITPELIIEELEKENIESRPIWKPMNLQPVYSKNDFIQIDSSNSSSIGEDIFMHGICLPSDIKNTSEDRQRIIDIIRKVILK